MKTESASPMRRSLVYRLAWLPVPLMLAAVLILWIADPRDAYESRTLLLLLNLVFTGLVSLSIGCLAGRAFLVSGRLGPVMLCWGALLWGLTTLVASVQTGRAGDSAITIHNVGVWAAALCHLGGLVWPGRVRHPVRWLTRGCGALIVVVVLLTWAATAGWIPDFFVEGQGGTMLRQVVLGSAMGMFALAAWLMLRTHWQSSSPFLYWYGVGLALLAVGLTGVMLQSVQGGVLGWVARGAQFLGGTYLLIAAVTARREAGGVGISLAAIEDSWRNELQPAIRNRPLLSWISRYSLAVLAVFVGFAWWLAVAGWLGPGLPPFISFYVPVTAVALLAGFWPGLLATALTALLMYFRVFPSPGDTLEALAVHRLSIVLFCVNGLLVCSVTALFRRDRSKAAAYDREVLLREGHKRMALFAETTFEGIVESRDGSIVDCNEQLARMLGYSVEELRGKGIVDLVAPEDRERVMRNICGSWESEIEHALVCRDGSRIIVEARGRPVSHGSPSRHTALRDITDRKQAESALARERDLLQSVLNSAGKAHLAYLDCDFNFVRVNETYAGSCGYRPEEMIGKNHFVLYPHAENEAIFRGVRDTGESVEVLDKPFEYPDRPERGVTYWDWTLIPVKDEAGQVTGLIFSLFETTAHKRAEKALVESESRFKLLSRTAARLLEADDPPKIVSELAHEIMEHLDCQVFFYFVADDQLGKLHLNAWAGIPDDEARKIEWRDYDAADCGCVAGEGGRVVAEDIHKVAHPRTDKLKSYGIQAYCCHPLMADRRVIGTLSFGTKTRRGFSLQDLDLMRTVADQVAVAMERMRLVAELERSRNELDTRVKSRTAQLAEANLELQEAAGALIRSEEKLRRNNELLQKVFDGISDPLFMLDGSGLVSMINRAAMSYYGVGRGADVLGKSCCQGLRGEDAAGPECNHPFLQAGTRKMSFERSGLNDPGRTENITVYPVFDDEGRREAAIVRISDITQAKILEKQIIQNEKLAALGLVTSGIAHEINNPNSFIYFNLPILRSYLEEIMPIVDEHAAMDPGFRVLNMSYGELREDMFRLLENMEHGSRRISKTIGVLRSFIRKRDLVGMQLVDMKELVEKVVALCQTELRQKLSSFEILVPDGLPPFVSDPEVLEQILLNLLINAIHASDKPDSRVILKVAGNVPGRDECIIEITDNGSGIEEAVRERIFDPFFTTKASNEGTGLGLYICHNHVASLGGRIEVESKVGEGATFRVVLPQKGKECLEDVAAGQPTSIH